MPIKSTSVNGSNNVNSALRYSKQQAVIMYKANQGVDVFKTNKLFTF